MTNKKTTPTSLREATLPQEGNFGERSLKFPSRGGGGNYEVIDGVVIIAILFATTFTAKAQYTFIFEPDASGNINFFTTLSTSPPGLYIGNMCIALPGTVALTINGDVNNMNRAFEGCRSLKEVIINGNVNNMNSAFEECSSLEKVTINGNVTYMHGAFMDCASLKEVTINGNVTDMSGAFWYCYDLSSITFTQTTPPTYMLNAFWGAGYYVDEVVVNLPFGADVNDWQTKLIAAGLDGNKLTIKLAEAPPRSKTKIGRINIKKGKVYIKPRE